MAAGNIIQGQGAGKLGDVVLMVRNGVQVARVYTKAGARTGDSASEASRIQRVRFGSASNQWQLYKYVCTRMYRKGKAGNQSDYNYFVRRNQGLLPYLTKQQNADGIHCLQPGILSEGSLGRIEIVTSYSSTTASGHSTFTITDAQVAHIAAKAWNSQLSSLKSTLRSSYPNATKIVYLFSAAPTVFVTEEGVDFESQTVSHTAITIDLYRESVPGENTRTIAEHFAGFFGTSELSTLISAQSQSIVKGQQIFSLGCESDNDRDIVKNLAVTVFATDENASDCYTTIVPEDGVPPTNSAYAVWASYRTSEALRIACESYGYQSGVMRDQVAAYGNSLQQQQQAYAARMRSLGVDIESADE